MMHIVSGAVLLCAALQFWSIDGRRYGLRRDVGIGREPAARRPLVARRSSSASDTAAVPKRSQRRHHRARCAVGSTFDTTRDTMWPLRAEGFSSPDKRSITTSGASVAAALGSLQRPEGARRRSVERAHRMRRARAAGQCTQVAFGGKASAETAKRVGRPSSWKVRTVLSLFCRDPGRAPRNSALFGVRQVLWSQA